MGVEGLSIFLFLFSRSSVLSPLPLRSISLSSFRGELFLQVAFIRGTAQAIRVFKWEHPIMGQQRFNLAGATFQYVRLPARQLVISLL